MRSTFIIWLLLLAPLSAQEKQPRRDTPVNGMTISCPGSGRSWGSDAMVATMKELKEDGVNWITIHPYAGIRNNGAVSGRLAAVDEAPEWIARPIREAHKLGLKVMMKPHLAYWGSKFSWRGEIDFQDSEERKRFFETYSRWIINMARLCKDADAFVVGTELDRLIQHEKEWRSIIAGVRKHYKGPLTYAANWSDYERVPFWNDLDVIGIQAYFPVLEARPAEGRLPTAAEVRSGWSRITGRLRTFSRSIGKKICFTELGYNRSADAPYRPWEYATGGDHAETLQKLCLEEALKAIDAEPVIVGSFLWKHFPGRRQPRNFNMHTKAMKDTIRKVWQRKKSPRKS